MLTFNMFLPSLKTSVSLMKYRCLFYAHPSRSKELLTFSASPVHNSWCVMPYSVKPRLVIFWAQSSDMLQLGWLSFFAFVFLGWIISIIHLSLSPSSSLAEIIRKTQMKASLTNYLTSPPSILPLSHTHTYTHTHTEESHRDIKW